MLPLCHRVLVEVPEDLDGVLLECWPVREPHSSRETAMEE